MNFNPRSREGSDGRCGEGRGRCREFQSTLPRRERQEWQGKVYSIDGFQSTLPRRERQIGGKNFDMSKNFNPRSREGSDPCAGGVRSL